MQSWGLHRSTAIIELQILFFIKRYFIKVGLYKLPEIQNNLFFLGLEDVKIKTRETPVNIILCKYCFLCF